MERSEESTRSELLIHWKNDYCVSGKMKRAKPYESDWIDQPTVTNDKDDDDDDADDDTDESFPAWRVYTDSTVIRKHTLQDFSSRRHVRAY